jgi:hypothetical protein
VKFPYFVVTTVLILFGTLLILELRERWKTKRQQPEKREAEELKGPTEEPVTKNWNPLYIVALTSLYIISIIFIKFISTTYLYVIGVRLIFGKVKVRVYLLDFVAIVFLYVIAVQVLRIPLPSGIIEDGVTWVFVKVF